MKATKATLPGLVRPDVVEIRGSELDALIARLASEGKFIIRMDSFRVSRWRCTIATMPQKLSTPPRAQPLPGVEHAA